MDFTSQAQALVKHKNNLMSFNAICFVCLCNHPSLLNFYSHWLSFCYTGKRQGMDPICLNCKIQGNCAGSTTKGSHLHSLIILRIYKKQHPKVVSRCSAHGYPRICTIKWVPLTCNVMHRCYGCGPSTIVSCCACLSLGQ